MVLSVLTTACTPVARAQDSLYLYHLWKAPASAVLSSLTIDSFADLTVLMLLNFSSHRINSWLRVCGVLICSEPSAASPLSHSRSPSPPAGLQAHVVWLLSTLTSVPVSSPHSVCYCAPATQATLLLLGKIKPWLLLWLYPLERSLSSESAWLISSSFKSWLERHLFTNASSSRTGLNAAPPPHSAFSLNTSFQHTAYCLFVKFIVSVSL